MADKQNLKYDRGTQHSFTHTYTKNGKSDDTGVTLYFTVKENQYDSSEDDSTAIVKKQVSMDGATNVITIEADDISDDVEPGKYYYDVKVKDTSGGPYLSTWGQFEISATPTNRGV